MGWLGFYTLLTILLAVGLLLSVFSVVDAWLDSRQRATREERRLQRKMLAAGVGERVLREAHRPSQADLGCTVMKKDA